MAQNVGFLAAAVSTAVVAKMAELPTPVAGVLSMAALGICVGVSSLLKVSIPPPQPKAKKLSKKEKRALAAANAPEEPDEDEAEDAAKEAKAAKKRLKDRARKEAKRAAALAEKQAAEQAEKAAVIAKEEGAEEKKAPGGKELSKAQKKKLKEKEKAKAKKAAAAAPAAEAAAPAAAPAASAFAVATPVDNWEEVKVKKGKKKVEEVPDLTSTAAKPAHMIQYYVERKYFGLIIGPRGSNLLSITMATGTEIELPKEGGMSHEVTITGPIEGCQRAKAAIDQLVAKGYCDITHAGTVDMIVAIPDNKRGIVIGSKGANIKMLQEKLGVKVNFPEKGSEDGVSIVGDAKAVQECAVAIKMLMEQGYSSVTHENFVQVNINVSRDMLKNLIGVGGSVIRGLQKSTGVQINIPSDKNGEIVVVALLGEPEGLADCRAQIDALLVPPEPTVIAPEWTQAASKVHVDLW